MKKVKIILFSTIFVMIMSFIVVSAYMYKISVDGTLTNTIDGNTVTRDPIYGEASIGGTITVNVTDIKNVSGTNAKGGIRVYVRAKRKNFLGIWGEKVGKYYSNDNHQAPSLTNTNDMSTTLSVEGNKLTRVEWENHTGNTSFYGTFTAK